jgi:hypothetical protein
MRADSRAMKIANFLSRRSTRYVLAWLVAIGAGGVTLYRAWTAFDSPRRADGTLRRPGGNNGHVMIDFGGQWLMGRMLAKGFGPELYHRNRIRQVLQEAYPDADEIPVSERKPDDPDQREAEQLMSWLLGRDDPVAARASAGLLVPLSADHPLSSLLLARANHAGAEDDVRQAATESLGGPLYPPIHALIMRPLGMFEPHQAYRLLQVVGLAVAAVAATGVYSLFRGAIWWPVAAAGVILFPGYYNSLALGQNSILMLAALIWGWALCARGSPVAGGMCWGVLAFKPVWAVAFLLVPLLSGRWRMCLSMVATVLVLVATTLLYVDVRTWLDWLQLGREATALYASDRNWVLLSRDLLSVPRRWLMDFEKPPTDNMEVAATVVGWTLFLGALECTARLAVLRRREVRNLVGIPAAFLFLGAWLGCFHFMYYDILLTALPVLLLLMDYRAFLRPRMLAVQDVAHAHLSATFLPNAGTKEKRLVMAAAQVERGGICVLNSLTLTLIALLAVSDSFFPYWGIDVSVSIPWLKDGPIPTPLKYSMAVAGTPWSTFCIVALWAWCGWRWLKMVEEESPSKTGTRNGEPWSLLSETGASSNLPVAHSAQLL